MDKHTFKLILKYNLFTVLYSLIVHKLGKSIIKYVTKFLIPKERNMPKIDIIRYSTSCSELELSSVRVHRERTHIDRLVSLNSY